MAPEVGPAGFVASLARCGVECEENGTVLTFTVRAVAGPLAGQDVPSGVGSEELAMWPGCPPHWVHLPETVVLAVTNADQTGTLGGWARHSRQIAGWGDAAEPGQAWLAHVRGVLGHAAA